MRKGLLSLALCPLLVLFVSTLLQAQGHTHAAHVHGEANLNATIGNNAIQLDLEAPLASLISFEHEPSTPEQKKEFEAMDALLKKPGELVTVSADYGCEASLTSLKYGEAEEEGHEHGDHGHGDHEHGDHEHGDHEHGDHDHGEAGHEHGDHEHGEADHDHGDHGHGDHDHGAVHRDADIQYGYVCKKLPESGQADLSPLFKSFPLLKTIHVQIVAPSGQKAQDLTPQDAILKW